VDRQGGPSVPAPSAAQRTIALYVHVPYCLSKCPYCDFNVYARRVWPEREYMSALAAELAHRASEPAFDGATIASIYFGGGTPSLFAPRSLAGLIEASGAHLSVDAAAEITLEANPEGLEPSRLAEFRAAGVNRLSLGVQSFQAHVLRVLGRHHSGEEARQVVRAARAAGFENLSLDLIYAVPGQSLEDAASDLEAAIALSPDHVSAYGLTYEEGTPLTRARDLGRTVPVAEEFEAIMLERIIDRLARAGYEHYEVSSHARPGFASRHNRSYWHGLPYLGLGAGAHSYVPHVPPVGTSWGMRWENLREPRLYMKSVGAARTAVAKDDALGRTQAMTEFCWLRLRQMAGLDVGDFAARFGEPLSAAFPDVGGLVEQGLLEYRGNQLALTRRGVLLADSVFACFVA
jgi:oxygen-independent coproporphyrinogen-3 oxidase